jgi:hypothetical protein
LAAEYTASPPTPTLPAIDPTSTTWPRPRVSICGSSSRASSIGETRSTNRSSSAWPAGMALNGPAQPTPAQATSRSTRPAAASAERASRSAPAAEARSAGSGTEQVRAATRSRRPTSRPDTGIIARQLLRGQTNFARMIWKFNNVYNADRQYSDHLRDPRYLLPPPAERAAAPPDRKELYVHVPTRRKAE